MEKANQVEFKVYGRYALFTDPITKVGGEKFSYQIPTYQALKGILESVYWKPTFIWVIDSVRVMNSIQTESQGIRPLVYGGGNTLSYYTYLKNVEYQIKAHFEWNENRPELAMDRNENKHYFIAKRMIERGGRRDIFLGTRECQGYVEPCVFGEGNSAYETIPELSFGLMYHGITYADEALAENEKGNMTVRFWQPVMKNGIIDFVKPEDCKIRKVIKPMKQKIFGSENFSGLLEFEKAGEFDGLDG